MAAQANINDVLEQLTDERRGIIYKLALDMLTAQQAENFDIFSNDDITQINKARERIANGDCLTFNNPNELSAYFGV